MGKVEKQLRKIAASERLRVLDAMEHIIKRDVSLLDRIKLKGYKHMFRVRIGDYRIIYSDDGVDIVFEAVVRRDDNTYSF